MYHRKENAASGGVAEPDECYVFASDSTSKPTPPTIAASAKLNGGHRPIAMKSTIAPCRNRSATLPAAPPKAAPMQAAFNGLSGITPACIRMAAIAAEASQSPSSVRSATAHISGPRRVKTRRMARNPPFEFAAQDRDRTIALLA